MGECPACDAPAALADYRCAECGKDLVDVDVASAGRESRDDYRGL